MSRIFHGIYGPEVDADDTVLEHSEEDEQVEEKEKQITRLTSIFIVSELLPLDFYSNLMQDRLSDDIFILC